MKSIIERAREVLIAEAEAIRNIPLDAGFERAASAIYACKGKVITTGMGKAGNIAKKMASTLCSTGAPAAFLHPGEAAHGDLGLAGAHDVIVAFSTSGKTREVLEMLALARKLGVCSIIGVTSHPDAPLRQICDCIVDMGVIHEPCSLGLTPTASTAAMLALSDALALVVMELRGFNISQYGLRHHGGYLGEKARNAESGPKSDHSAPETK